MASCYALAWLCSAVTLSLIFWHDYRESVASSYMDEDDSDTTSCNEEDPISYNDFMDSRRSSEYTNASYASNNRQSVDFADADMYNSLARK